MSVVRNRETRIADTIRRLEDDVDLWVASADPETGAPYLIPLSFDWDGTAILIATPRASVTGTNLERSRLVRLALGTLRDVVLIDGSVVTIPESQIDLSIADHFAARSGFDPRASTAEYAYFRITPVRIQAWNEEPELAGRTIMRDGIWQDQASASSAGSL